MKPIILMILSKVPSNDGEACPVAAGGCTVHTGRTLHYTGAVVSLSFCQLLFCRTRWRCKYIELRAGFGTFGPAWLHLSRPSGTQAMFYCMWREVGKKRDGRTEEEFRSIGLGFIFIFIFIFLFIFIFIFPVMMNDIRWTCLPRTTHTSIYIKAAPNHCSHAP